jgi:holliday junction DNA helicase RuvA
MIARLKGQVATKTAGSAVIMAGGVGYEVFISLPTFYELPDDGETVTLHIRTVVRDDAIELFGFMTAQEKEAFLLLNSVSKIGPRLALSILSGLTPGELIAAVSGKNLARLNAVPGVGAKTAERVILELKDKIAGLSAMVDPTPLPTPDMPVLDETAQDAVSALVNLGYSRNEAEKAVAAAGDDAGPEPPDISALIRLSLKKLRKDS